MPEDGALDSLPSWILTRAANRAHRILHRRLSEAGFTGYEYRVLAALATSGPASQADIGRSAQLDRRDVTHTVRGLEERDLVVRTRHDTDDRQLVVQLTDEAADQWPSLAEIVQKAQSEILAPLTRSESQRLITLLERVGEDQDRV